MTEEDTFRILKRPTRREILAIFGALSPSQKAEVYVSEKSRNDWFVKYGWTLDEYRKSRERDRQ